MTKNNKIITTNFIMWSLLLIAVFIIICMCIPDFYLDRYLHTKYTYSGQIGDIVGGTTAPFIAIIASLLTFIAFWIQYKANVQQREDISIERFENSIYEMLSLHRENLFDITCGDATGRDAIYNYCYKLNGLFIIVSAIIQKMDNDDKELYFNYCEGLGLRYLDEGMTVISYNLFLYGANYCNSFSYQSNERKLYDKICSIIAGYEIAVTEIDKKTVYDDDFTNNANETIYRYLNQDESVDIYSKPDDFLCGYNTKLGVYYRQLYQLVRHISDKEGFNENIRYKYLKIVRSQLSDFEQILLYYNGLSPYGIAWNKPIANNENTEDWLQNMGLIARFRLIKNIPSSFKMFGFLPEYKYFNEMSLYTGNAPDKKFFESRAFDLVSE